MADITAIFFILLIIGIAFPAMLSTLWLLFPSLVSRAQSRVERTPWRSFWMGMAVLVGVTIPIIILLSIPFGPAKLIGWILLGTALAISSIGAAGIASHLSVRLSRQSTVAPLGGYLRAAVLLELAAFFPVIGWLFIWIPIVIVSFGATTFALLNWTPQDKTQLSSPVSSTSQA